MASVNMRDVAKHAGVSVATVSHVINHTRYVKEETRRKVLDSIEQLNYSPDILARGLKTGRRNLIAFIVPDISNIFYATLIEEIESVIAQEGYKLVICNTKEDPLREIENIRLMSTGLVDGFVIASSNLSYEPIDRVLPMDIPAVFLDRNVRNCPRDSLLINNYNAVYQAVNHLISQGHRRIAYISPAVMVPKLSTIEERLRAYMQAMTQNGLYKEELICNGNPLGNIWTDTFSNFLDTDCTAVICPNDTLTAKTLDLLARKGLTPGKDIEVVGYQETQRPLNPLLIKNYVQQPTEALGHAVGLQILQRLENPSFPIRQTILEATFHSVDNVSII